MQTSKEAPIKWDIHAFEKAYKEAIFLKRDHLEVPTDFFDTLCMQYLAGEKADCFTYGKPGIKVYREGKREQIEEENDMEVDEHTKLMSDRNPNKKKKRHG